MPNLPLHNFISFAARAFKVFGVLCLMLGFCTDIKAETGIPFGLFWGANLEDISKVCTESGFKCRQKSFNNNTGEKLEVIAEFAHEGREYKASFLIEQNRLVSIRLLRYINGNDASKDIQDCARDFGNFNGFISSDDYELLGEENSNGSSLLNYLTAASRITVFYGPVAPGTTLMAFYWNPLAVDLPTQQNELNDIERSLDDLKQ